MKTFRRFAFISTVATYVLIFIGGLVRASGAGLGCPDWPKCFGRWMPPLNANQLPPEIDPQLFNFTLAWIEYINRLIGVTVGIIILITTILAIKHYRTAPKILYSTIAALALTAFQGWYGSRVVASELLPITITIHMVLAFIIAGLLIYVTQQAYYQENPDVDAETMYPKNANLWVWALGVSAIAQIILGSQIRSSLEILSGKFPLLRETALLDMVGAVQNLHWVLGVIMFFLSWHFGIKLLKFSVKPSMLVRQSVSAMMFLILAQIIMGIVIVAAGLPRLAQLFHLWIASLYFGMIIILLTALIRRRRVSLGLNRHKGGNYAA